MRTERGWKRFYATGWFFSVLIGVGAFHQWLERTEAEQQRLRESLRTREAVLDRVAAEERLRIARELHDSLTHSISVVKIQAGAVAHRMRKEGREVPESLQAIIEASDEASRSLRETLGALRRPEDPGRAAGGFPGLEDLPRLLDHARATGLEVEQVTTGTARELPRETGQAAYRIVQEALTNVSRHAGASRARVELAYAEDEVVVQVDDDGLGARGVPDGPGLGLVGMRERAGALGGRLVAQGRPGRGFTVRAELPAIQDTTR